MLSKAKLEILARKSGIDLVAVAPAARFADVEPHRNPLTIFPQARSIIMCAQEIPRGVFRGIEEGTLWTRPGRLIEPHYIYTLARHLEDLGKTAVPISPLAAERWPEGVVFRTGKVEPNVYPDLAYGAVACGLAEIGLCGFILTRQLGIRQALGMIITDLVLEADPLLEPSLCQGTDCGACAAACPLHAIDLNKVTEQTVCGVSFKVAAVNRQKCSYCPNGAFPDTTHANAMPNRLAAACGRACLVQLEGSGQLERKYQTQFRRRPAWGIDLAEI